MIHHLPIIIGMLVAIVSPIVSYYVKIPLVLVEFIIGILFLTTTLYSFSLFFRAFTNIIANIRTT